MPAGNDAVSAINKFADRVTENFKLPVAAQPEDQLKSPVGELLRSVGRTLALDVDFRTEAQPHDVGGRPDLAIVTERLLTGYIELKAPQIGARAERLTGANKKQWQRFKALPNLIYTNGAEWHLYRLGQHVMGARISGDVSIDGARGLRHGELNDLAALLRDFLHWQPIVPSSPRALAELLAPLTRLLRDEVEIAVSHGNPSLSRAQDEWRGLLFPDADEGQFADAYAQTVSYALLLARLEGAESVRPALATEALRPQHSLLAEALVLLEYPPVLEEVGMPIQLLERVIDAVDPERLSIGGDPWLYFYEDFLASYDPKLRKDRGVYFTPVEVVHAQVRLVAELLSSKFSKPRTYANSSVVVLDPAVGTGTYPLAVIDHAAEFIRTELGEGAVPAGISDLAERLYAFEILVGPYSVAHLRVSQRLHSVGAQEPSGGVQVYLTDTLESPFEKSDFQVGLLQERLSVEHERAQEVKRDVRVFVCLGNPPYNREGSEQPGDSGRRKGGWVRYGGSDDDRPILDDFTDPVRAAGQGVHLKNLYNDYVYFWRWALWKVFETTEGPGIVTFITASSYLRGPAFAGLRRRLRETADELWIIDLEGGSLGARVTENVFSIKTPVAIAIAARYGPPDPGEPARVRRTKFTGSAAEKLGRLESLRSLDELEWESCSNDWEAPFYPPGGSEYHNWPTVTDIFPWQHTGAELKRTWPIGETQELLERRSAALMRLDAGRRKSLFRETRDRKVDRSYLSLMDGGERLAPIAGEGSPLPAPSRYGFRSFDRQWVIPDSRVGDFMKPVLWRTHSQEQLYMVSFLTEVVGHGQAATVSAEVPRYTLLPRFVRREAHRPPLARRRSGQPEYHSRAPRVARLDIRRFDHCR